MASERISLTKFETEVMSILWRLGEATVRPLLGFLVGFLCRIRLLGVHGDGCGENQLLLQLGGE